MLFNRMGGSERGNTDQKPPGCLRGRGWHHHLLCRIRGPAFELDVNDPPFLTVATYANSAPLCRLHFHHRSTRLDKGGERCVGDIVVCARHRHKDFAGAGDPDLAICEGTSAQRNVTGCNRLDMYLGNALLLRLRQLVIRRGASPFVADGRGGWPTSLLECPGLSVEQTSRREAGTAACRGVEKSI